ncbi:MAG: hypothetical protein KY446_12625 [Proteobacteria bacterium]|nr:hypothetical protein [Pseudomonadota bacterium]
MSAVAQKTDPELWERVKHEITAGDKGGRPGVWSARKAQMAVQEYKRRGGGFVGVKPDSDNHLLQWEKEEWGTRSGRESLETGERYLPKRARETLSEEEYARTTEAKREGLRQGERQTAQPEAVARKTALHRGGHGKWGDKTKADLLAEARKRNIAGRSRMTRDELEQALIA